MLNQLSHPGAPSVIYFFFLRSLFHSVPHSVIMFFKKFSFFCNSFKKHFVNLFDVYLFFERQSTSGKGAAREGDTQREGDRLQALSCQHRAWRGAQTHKPRGHDLSWSQTPNQLSYPGTPNDITIVIVWISDILINIRLSLILSNATYSSLV